MIKDPSLSVRSEGSSIVWDGRVFLYSSISYTPKLKVYKAKKYKQDDVLVKSYHDTCIDLDSIDKC